MLFAPHPSDVYPSDATRFSSEWCYSLHIGVMLLTSYPSDVTRFTSEWRHAPHPSDVTQFVSTLYGCLSIITTLAARKPKYSVLETSKSFSSPFVGCTTICVCHVLLHHVAWHTTEDLSSPSHCVIMFTLWLATSAVKRLHIWPWASSLVFCSCSVITETAVLCGRWSESSEAHYWVRHGGYFCRVGLEAQCFFSRHHCHRDHSDPWPVSLLPNGEVGAGSWSASGSPNLTQTVNSGSLTSTPD